MKIEYTPHGVCSRQINIEVDEQGKIVSLEVIGGCNGNLKGISALVKGMDAESVIESLKGIDCNGKGTSCPDQISKALEQYRQSKQS